MKYLVDANVLSEPTKPTPDPRVVAWLRAHEPDIAVDPVILGEIRFGILLLPRGKRRRRLEGWFDEGIARIQCLPWDASLGLRWAARCRVALKVRQAQLLPRLRPRRASHDFTQGDR